MSAVSFAAAWVPFTGASYEPESALAAAWTNYMAQQRGLRRTLVTPQAMQRTANGFVAAFARGADLATPRSKHLPRQSRAVFSYVPDWQQLDLSQLYARSGVLAVVEEHDPVLRGWAQAVGAINLLTKAATPDPADDEVRAAIERIHQGGYNGWNSSIGERTATMELTKLRDAGWTDRARIVGGIVASGGRVHHLDELNRVLDRVLGPDLGAGLGLRFHRQEDQPRCPVDGVPMIDAGSDAVRWVCRSCGRIGELQYAD